MERIKAIFWIAVGVSIVGYFIYKVAINSFTDNFMGDSPLRIKAVIINEKNYPGNQPVSPKFTYSYLFSVNGRIYTGNSHDINLRIGDSIEVEYNRTHPEINQPISLKD